MWNSMTNCFDKLVSMGSYEGSKAIYRDELKKKPSQLKLKKGDCVGNRQPLLFQEEDVHEKKVNSRRRSHVSEEKGVMRVKVKMTKQEAVILLSKCRDGGVLGFRDVANELIQIPANRVSVGSCPGGAGYGGMLKSIPEEE
uniref:DUF7890 domain-containing protein n=1 Tax=Rhizophora mucronata TaxID=61149 RepID=A0A2P2P0E9_RHIMU